MDKGAFSLGEIENDFEGKRAYLTQYLLPVPEALRIFGRFQVSSGLQTIVRYANTFDRYSSVDYPREQGKHSIHKALITQANVHSNPTCRDRISSKRYPDKHV